MFWYLKCLPSWGEVAPPWPRFLGNCRLPQVQAAAHMLGDPWKPKLPQKQEQNSKNCVKCSCTPFCWSYFCWARASLVYNSEAWILQVSHCFNQMWEILRLKPTPVVTYLKRIPQSHIPGLGTHHWRWHCLRWHSPRLRFPLEMTLLWTLRSLPKQCPWTASLKEQIGHRAFLLFFFWC